MPVLENPHYEIFAREIAKGTNNREAYRLAGYGTENDRAADACACRLLADVSVALRVKEIQERAAKRAEIDIESVLLELAKLGFANMADYMQAGADGDFSKLTRDQAAALSEVTVEDFKDGRCDNARDVRRIKFKLHDKRAALVDIGKHLSMFSEKVELTGKNGGPIETKEVSNLELARRIAFILKQAEADAGKENTDGLCSPRNHEDAQTYRKTCSPGRPPCKER
jgi:phage terminase small subunit